jgi:formamidase
LSGRVARALTWHNRWHPDIPAAVSIKPGEVFRADVREWFDGAIRNDDSADDVRNAPLPGVHVLTGPFHVEGAEPGDLLIVDILEIDACDQEDSGPFSGVGWGYTGVFATKNGGSAVLGVDCVLGCLGRPRWQAALSGLAVGLLARL